MWIENWEDAKEQILHLPLPYWLGLWPHRQALPIAIFIVLRPPDAQSFSHPFSNPLVAFTSIFFPWPSQLSKFSSFCQTGSLIRSLPTHLPEASSKEEDACICFPWHDCISLRSLQPHEILPWLRSPVDFAGAMQLQTRPVFKRMDCPSERENRKRGGCMNLCLLCFFEGKISIACINNMRVKCIMCNAGYNV